MILDYCCIQGVHEPWQAKCSQIWVYTRVAIMVATDVNYQFDGLGHASGLTRDRHQVVQSLRGAWV